MSWSCNTNVYFCAACVSVLFLVHLVTVSTPQLQGRAPMASSPVAVASVWRRPSCATGKTTVRMVVMRLPVQRPPAAPAPSSATTPGVCQGCGRATETLTAWTGQTSGRRTDLAGGPSCPPRHPAQHWSSTVAMESASMVVGGATAGTTAMTALMKSTAVSIRFLIFLFLKRKRTEEGRSE